MHIFEFKTFNFNRNYVSTLKRNIKLLPTVTSPTNAAFTISMLNCFFEGF